MSTDEQPQLYLITPPRIDPGFPDLLARILDAREVACLRLDLAGAREEDIARHADPLREVAHAREVALVISDHVLLAQRLGLDGVHLRDGARSVRVARHMLGADAIIGSYCGTSRHEGMNAGEAGADYIGFGPVGETGLGDGSRAEGDLFAWWSDLIEIPVVAEGGLTPDLVAMLAPVTDFFGIGAEIWDHEAPLAALDALLAPLGNGPAAR
ncbi:thiamine phosphate synthase [Pontibaca methylaminivorans]|uniref:Thiamine-phosphate pyrophosphorylase n=1 Tax=Pontibaca methylaminivorans TaxID=515897 RepID=A0A1R3W8B8_9RHOB|nr:thiamine phosphate synthase [Pontibaca methylaminivorans]SIT74193.1 thiamine-phosphate pyrophosphorylase [Pontibaca methylaminivorans]